MMHLRSRFDAGNNRVGPVVPDANGNQQLALEPSGNRTTNTWDYENLTTKVEQPAASVSTYTWNADNHRVAKNVNDFRKALGRL